jgi:hypothetical protein
MSGDAISLDDARALLLEERRDRLQRFNAELQALTRAHHCRLVPIVTLPGGEEVALSSLLEALGIQGEPGLRIVEVGEG